MKLTLQILNFELIFAFHFRKELFIHHNLLVERGFYALFFSFVLCELVLKQIILSPDLSDLTIFLLIFFHGGDFSVEDVILQFAWSVDHVHVGGLVNFLLDLDVGVG